MIITIDGPSVSGKGSAAKALAKKLNIFYLDTGSLYRAVAYVASLEYSREQCTAKSLTPVIIAHYLSGISYSYSDGRARLSYNGRDITSYLRTKEIDDYSSTVSALPSVRNALRGLQRKLGNKHSLVIDGRDCGTVIFPQADYKIFLTARLDVRVARLLSDITRGNIEYARDEARADIIKRDVRDISRKLSPLQAASDARIMDNSCLTLDETVDFLCSYITV